MKNLLLSMALVLCSSTALMAKLKIPATVYKADNIAEAVTEAKKRGKGLAFVLTDDTTT